MPTLLLALPRAVTDDIAPGYSSVIANPMDLGKIDKKLKKGHYGLPSEVWHDLRLIWDNCRAYNEAGTDIVDLCERLQREAEAIWERRGLARSGAGKRPNTAVGGVMRQHASACEACAACGS